MRVSLLRLGQAGSTLAEALVASTIGLVAVGAFTSFNITQMYGMRDRANQVDLQTSARAITDLFAREVRRAGGGTNVGCVGTASTGILVAQSSQLRFRVDLDGNGSLNGPNEDVTYTLNFDDSRITRTDNGSSRTDTLWSGVNLAGSQVSYFDGAGTQLDPGSTGLTAAQLLQVRRIKFKLSLTGKVTQPGNSLRQTAAEAADVDLRNRYFVMSSICAYN